MNLLIAIAIIAISLGMVAGPAMALRSSKGEQRQQSLREHARKLGLQVSVEPLPLRTGDKNRPLIAVYRLVLEKHLPASINHCARRARLDTKEWMFLRNRPELGLYEKLLKLYEQLPDDVEAVECMPHYIAVWWHEKGNAERLQQLSQQMHKIVEIQYNR